MIFRTGSVLIVGKCDDTILHKVYNFIKNILIDEYSNIYIENNESNKDKKLTKKIKTRFIGVRK